MNNFVGTGPEKRLFCIFLSNAKELSERGSNLQKSEIAIILFFRNYRKKRVVIQILQREILKDIQGPGYLIVLNMPAPIADFLKLFDTSTLYQRK